MTRADVVAKWSSLTPGERDGWVSLAIFGNPTDQSPPFSSDNWWAMKVAAKLGLAVIPIPKVAGDSLSGWVAAKCRVNMPDGCAGWIEADFDPGLIQPTPAEAVCLAGLVYVEGQGGEG